MSTAFQYNQFISLESVLDQVYPAETSDPKEYFKGQSINGQLGEIKDIVPLARFPLSPEGRTGKSGGTLDKEATSYNDIFDAFRMSLLNYKLVKPYRLCLTYAVYNINR